MMKMFRSVRKSRNGAHPGDDSLGEDIPVAQRSLPPYLVASRQQPNRRWLTLSLLSLSLSLAALVLLLGPLRWLIPRQPVPGLRASLSADGRLLGHFPYPQARAALLQEVAPGQFLRPDAAERFLAMQRAAAADGVSLVLLSAFRSVDQQRQLFFSVKAERNQNAMERARVSAPPGFSEHSTGYAIDLGDGRRPETNLSAAFDQTIAFQWLQNNAARYQYVLSFPQNNPQGVSFEPWHWRFEGSTESLQLFEPAHRLMSAAAQGLKAVPR